MLTSDPETIEVRCPTCKETVKVSAKEAEKKMSVRCSRGHEIALVKAL